MVAKLLAFLPNLRRISESSLNVTANSIFPPDSDTAWASIYTGLNPAKHGIVDFVDPLERAKINKDQLNYLDASSIRGKTFWDIASHQGKRVCLIYPHMAYPVWPINGFMASPHPKTGEVQFYPSDFTFKFDYKKPIVHKRIPKSKLEYKEYVVKKHETVINEFSLGRQMLMNYDWDVFFLYSSALDSIMHLFWNYCDPDDPTYPGETPFKDVINDFHVLYDQLIGQLLEGIDPSTAVLLLSDHGHSMRPVKLFNVNEVLRNAGFLVPKEGVLAPVHSMTEKFKRGAANLAQRWGLRAAAMTIVRTFPQLKKMYTVPLNIDFEATVAHCTDLSGMKAYSYGGIKVSKEKFRDYSTYEKVREKIINLLKGYKLPGSDENVVQWICKREELYTGKHLEKYPDIVFNLKDGYGAGWGIHMPVFSKTVAHRFYPGSHRGSTPVFFLRNGNNRKFLKREVSFMDIAPTILDMLDINWREFNFDGESIFSS